LIWIHKVVHPPIFWVRIADFLSLFLLRDIADGRIHCTPVSMKPNAYCKTAQVHAEIKALVIWKIGLDIASNPKE
jgi:hypothetical protein